MLSVTLPAILASVAIAAGCRPSSSPTDESGATNPANPAPTASKHVSDSETAAATEDSACAGPVERAPLAWFEDDYDAALKCAEQSGRPLFIDEWAPWCHTCISMQEHILTDKALAPLAKRFVWLAIDTDKEVNAAAVEQFPPQVWPTFYVVAPTDESVQARSLGAASVKQLRTFLQSAERTFLDSAADRLAADDPLALLRDGDRAIAGGDAGAAASHYRAALNKTEADWDRRPDVLVALISALYRTDAYDACAALAEEELAHTGKSASAADFAYYASICASNLDDQDRMGKLRQVLETHMDTLVNDEAAPLSADDRGDAMRIWRTILIAMGQEDKARQVAERQRTFLDQAAAEADNAFAAMTYNWPRAEVYDYLGIPAQLISDLQASVKALPNEYDPAYRLAWIYLQAKQPDKALPMAEQALKLVYGPRKANVQRLIANIYNAQGNRDAERAAREAVIEIYRNLPVGQQRPAGLAQAEAALVAMDKDQ